MNLMVKLWKSPFQVVGGLFAAGLLTVAYGAIARPGTVNYAEGTVTLSGRSIDAKSLGSTEVESGQVLQTQQGRAEMLLTPGVYLRLGDNSSVRMVSPSLTDTRVELQKGQAMVEVDQIAKENHIEVTDNAISTTLDKKGIYQFDADRPSVAVWDGKAIVRVGDRNIEVKKGKQLALDTQAALEPAKFDRNQVQAGGLYDWSKLRSEYAAQASQATAQTVIVDGGGWYGPGWYWNPWYTSWAFVPGDGFFYNPFGFGFFAPSYFSYGGFYGGYPRYYHGPHYGRFPGGGVHHAPVGRPAPVGGSGVHFGGHAAIGGSGAHFGGGGGARHR